MYVVKLQRTFLKMSCYVAARIERGRVEESDALCYSIHGAIVPVGTVHEPGATRVRERRSWDVRPRSGKWEGFSFLILA
jgi:hypothetical protein